MTGAGAAVRVAVVGAGPAGFYTAESLFGQADLVVAVDLFDRLPVPFGLVRYGVAPDHPGIRAVTATYTKIAANPAFRFFGNVCLGRDLGLEDLLACYHAVILSTGCEADRALGIPGEELAGSASATDFVGWYNGHPDHRDHRFELGGPTAVVVGMGNVAVDVARILLRDRDELAETDIDDAALAALRKSGVHEVVMLGRRGPAQAAFSSKELKELAGLQGLRVEVPGWETMVPDPATVEALPRDARRNLEILSELASAPPAASGERRLVLRFLASPVSIEGDGGRVSAVRIEHNRLDMAADGSIRAVGTGQTEALPAQAVFRAVGYRAEPIPGVPFDPALGRVPQADGRILSGPGGTPVPGLYAAGWIKRGPTGLIGSNKADAAATVRTLLDDQAAGHLPEPSVSEPVETLLAGRGVTFTDWAGWLRIDRFEQEEGQRGGRARRRLSDPQQLLQIARSTG